LAKVAIVSASSRLIASALQSDFKKAQELLKETGYDGTPIVLMHSTDLQTLTNLAPVAKALMEKAGCLRLRIGDRPH
jgi:peptide/nickel transport system substrate-binding protein